MEKRNLARPVLGLGLDLGLPDYEPDQAASNSPKEIMGLVFKTVVEKQIIVINIV